MHIEYKYGYFTIEEYKDSLVKGSNIVEDFLNKFSNQGFELISMHPHRTEDIRDAGIHLIMMRGIEQVEQSGVEEGQGSKKGEGIGFV